MSNYDTLVLFFNKKANKWGVGHRMRSLAKRLRKYFNVLTVSSKAGLPSCDTAKTIIHFLSVGSRYQMSNNYKEDWRKVSRTCWGVELTQFELSREWLFDEKLLTGASYIVAKNLDLKTEAEKRMPNIKCVYLPNGVELDTFTPVIRVGWIGYTNSPKNIDHDHKGVGLIGHVIQKLNEEFHGKAIFKFVPSPTIWPTKILTHEEVANHMRTLDVYVNASRSEGCSNTVMEAVSLGVPLVTTKTGIWEELSQQGLVIAVNRDIEDMRRGILLAVKDRLDRSALLRDNYSWDKVTDQYMELFKTLGLKER